LAGWIADTDIDTYTPSQLILVDHDTLAQYWEAFGHISFYRRVPIERIMEADDDHLGERLTL